MRSLRDLLVNDFGLGTSLAGWTLTRAESISADGQFVVGSGTNPGGNAEAWFARLGSTLMLPGDYNNDGNVDAADYTVWRNNLGSLTALSNDDTAGVGEDDYDRWKTHFGETNGSGSGASANTAVPEPATLVMLILAAAGWCLRRRRFAQRSPNNSLARDTGQKPTSLMTQIMCVGNSSVFSE